MLLLVVVVVLMVLLLVLLVVVVMLVGTCAPLSPPVFLTLLRMWTTLERWAYTSEAPLWWASTGTVLPPYVHCRCFYCCCCFYCFFLLRRAAFTAAFAAAAAFTAASCSCFLLLIAGVDCGEPWVVVPDVHDCV